MSEYQEKHSVSKLIGSPPGYVGFEENAGLLITQIQENPNAVLLFDEIEKSHPDVSTILLQMMDNGFITGSNGKKADCRNIVLILTTNAGAQASEKNHIGFGQQEKDYSDADIKKFFAPEFRNRLDGIVRFGKLDQQTMIKIVKKFVDELNGLLKDKNVAVKPSVETVEFLISKGFDKKMGARPLQRTIDEHIKKPLSKEILFGKLTNGGVVEITVENNNLKLNYVEILPIKEINDAETENT
jgi:ATP-dependent Clp protease ATP-binding subunit ClpA